jgi:cyanophycinase
VKSYLGFYGLLIGGSAALIASVSLTEAHTQEVNKPQVSTTYRYVRLGQDGDVSPKTSAGVALLGGGWVPIQAWTWLCNKSGGGDFLILAASEENGYTDSADTVNYFCDENSVSTLVIPSREAANDPFVASVIRKAEAIVISGGIQGDYIKLWKGTPVEVAINDQISRGIPIGGVSAGLAILGEFSYTGAWARSDDTLRDPYNERVSITSGFLTIPALKGIITDTHLVARQRLGRLLGFMARIAQDGLSKNTRGVGVDEQSAVLLEDDGSGAVIGKGSGAYFIKSNGAPTICKPSTPLTFQHIEVQKVAPGGYFNMFTWTSPDGSKYELTVENGKVSSTAPVGY